MAWLSRNDWTNSDRLIADMLNSLANDDRAWGGDVNGGGYHLSNVILDGSGGFQYALSPVSITQGVDGESRLELRKGSGATSLLRWALVKDAVAETGANAGANFAINRYNDAGALLGTTFGINRATGVVTMGPQHWTGPIDGGGQTITNIAGVLADPTTTKGDLLVRSATAVTRLAVSTDGMVLTLDSAQTLGVKWAAAAGGVPTSRQVIAGAGLSGGGSLAADVTLTAVPMGPSGGSHAAGIVPDPGATAGGTRYLREDATWAIPAGAGGGLTDPTTTLGDLIVRGSAATTRLGVGANGQVLTADSAQATGVKWAPAAAGGVSSVFTRSGAVVAASGDYTAAQVTNAVSTLGSYGDPAWITSLAWAKITGAPATSQTPWLSNINAAGFNLTGVANVGIGTATPVARGDVVDVSRPYTDAYSGLSSFRISSGGGAVTDEALLFGVHNTDYSWIQAVKPGTTVRSLLLNPTGGNVGIANTAPGYPLDVTGDVNCTGAFRVGGVAIGTGGISGVVSTGHALNTIYQNTSGKPRFVNVLANLGVAGYIQLKTDAGTSPTAVVCAITNAHASITLNFTAGGWVMPGHYYQAVTSGASLTGWYEWT